VALEQLTLGNNPLAQPQSSAVEAWLSALEVKTIAQTNRCWFQAVDGEQG
jgi:hypothetical protein